MGSADVDRTRPVATRRVVDGFAGYVIITLGWTWTIWFSLAATGLDIGHTAVMPLFLLGGLGPLAGAAWVLKGVQRVDRRAFLQRVWDPRGIRAIWWIALVAVSAGPALLGASLAAVTGAATVAVGYSAVGIVGVVAFALAAGLAEEPGWRGAALDVLQVRTRPVWAALAIGAVWAVWHLPLYFIEGTYQHDVGFGTLRFWLTSLALIQLGVLYTWLVNGAAGSILIAVLAHAAVNIAGELTPWSEVRDLAAFVVMGLAAVAVIVLTRGELRRGVQDVPAA